MHHWVKLLNYPLDINRAGQVRNLRGRPVKIGIDTKGYPQVPYKNNLGKWTTVKLHKLLAIAFIPNPENKSQINHIDGNKANFKLSNLEWCTQSENQIHSYRVLKNGGGFPALSGRASKKLKGCTKVASGWQSRIVANGRRIYLGTFKNKIEAAEAYNIAAECYHDKPILNEV